MEAIAANQSHYKLISASDMRLARRLGESLAVIEITHGDKRARVTPEDGGRLLIIDTRGELYELEQISN